MNKTVFAALWIVLVVIGSGFAGTIWFLRFAAKQQDAYLDVMEYEKTPLLYVPVVRDGRVAGYVYMQLVFTVDAAVLHAMRVEPGAYVANSAFRSIYDDETLDFTRIKKTDLGSLTEHVRDEVNARFGSKIVHDVLIEQFGYRAPDEVAS